MSRARSYQTDLIQALRDPREAAEYLAAALEEGDCDLFALALKNVVEARKLLGAQDLGGFTPDAIETSLQEGMLICRFQPFLERMGLKLTVAVKEHTC